MVTAILCALSPAAPAWGAAGRRPDRPPPRARCCGAAAARAAGPVLTWECGTCEAAASRCVCGASLVVCGGDRVVVVELRSGQIRDPEVSLFHRSLSADSVHRFGEHGCQRRDSLCRERMPRTHAGLAVSSSRSHLAFFALAGCASALRLPPRAAPLPLAAAPAHAVRFSQKGAHEPGSGASARICCPEPAARPGAARPMRAFAGCWLRRGRRLLL